MFVSSVGPSTAGREVRGPLCLVTNPTLAMPQSLFYEEEKEAKRVDMLLHGVLLDGSRKSWKTFSFEMNFRNGGYIKYSQTGSVKRGKGKPKKPNSSLQPSLQPDLTHETGVTEPSPLPPGPLPGPHPTSLQPTVGPAGTPRSITPTQSTEVLISQTLGLAGKYLEILNPRGEKRAPSPSPSCDLDFVLKAGDSASTIPRELPKKKVCFKSSQLTRSALPENLLRADIKQLDGFVSDDSSGGECSQPAPGRPAPMPWCEEGANTSDTAGGWTVVPPRGGRNRGPSPVTVGTAVPTVKWTLSTADGYVPWPKLSDYIGLHRTTKQGFDNGEMSSGRKKSCKKGEKMEEKSKPEQVSHI